MQKPKHIVLVAGEESGDLHAAKLVMQLKAQYPDARFTGIGGTHLQAAGVELISDLAKYAVTGVTEVFRFFFEIRKAFKAIQAHLKATKPDLLLLVDYPGFNLRLARYAKKELNQKIIYYISPQIWAWKANRIHLIKKCVDRMAVILPFEKSIYTKAGVPVDFVGHPLVETLKEPDLAHASRKELGLAPDQKIIALLPGSRRNEIMHHLPILCETAALLLKHYPNAQFVLPVATSLAMEHITRYTQSYELPLTLVHAKALECMSAADFVLVASGTASLECALLEKPMCIVYKSSFLTYHLVMKVIQVRFLGLCNLLSGRMIVSEFLQYDCNPHELVRYICDFFNNPQQPKRMVEALRSMKESLSANKADCSLFDVVKEELGD
jgi:lipid-A-disaccharide synthase